MANRFPLIVDSSALQIKELPASDNLDLSNSGIVNASSLSATSLTIVDSSLTGGVVVTGVSTFSGDISANNVLVGGGLTITQGVSINGEPLVVGSDTVSFTGAGVTVAGISTFHGGAHFDGGGLIKEKIQEAALSAKLIHFQ